MLWGSRPCPHASAAASVAGWTAGTAGDFCRHGPMPPGLPAKPEHTILRPSSNHCWQAAGTARHGPCPSLLVHFVRPWLPPPRLAQEPL